MINIEVGEYRDDKKGLRCKAVAKDGDAVVAELDVPSYRSVICPLCRLLVAAGIDPAREVTIIRKGMVLFQPTTVGYWADRMISEGNRSIRLVPYKEYEKEGEDDG